MYCSYSGIYTPSTCVNPPVVCPTHALYHNIGLNRQVNAMKFRCTCPRKILTCKTLPTEVCVETCHMFCFDLAENVKNFPVETNREIVTRSSRYHLTRKFPLSHLALQIFDKFAIHVQDSTPERFAPQPIGSCLDTEVILPSYNGTSVERTIYLIFSDLNLPIS